ncbi:hypothetical protein TNCV_2428491 [Trichonephila clavipes]|nr:hypothetical protein TNCV_2428491 [Trichonephila clavipes]
MSCPLLSGVLLPTISDPSMSSVEGETHNWSSCIETCIVQPKEIENDLLQVLKLVVGLEHVFWTQNLRIDTDPTVFRPHCKTHRDL